MALPKQEFIITAKDQSKQAFDSVAKSVGGINNLLAGIGVGISLGGLAAAVKSAANFSDEMGKVAQKVGITTESISGLKYAADLSDVSFESLQVGLKKIAVNAFEAADGNKALAADFKRLGIDVLNTNGALKSSDTLLLEVADKFKGMKDGAEKTALAVKLLGKSGSDLIPFLNGGAAGIKALTDEASHFGLVVDQESARAAEEFNDNLTRIQAAGRGLAQQFGNQLIPAFTDLSIKTVENIKQLGILKGLLVSLADGIEIGVFGTDEAQRIERISVLTKSLTFQQKRLAEASSDTNKQVLANISNRIAREKKEFKELVLLQSAALKPNALPKSVEKEFETTPTASTGKSKAQSEAEAAVKSAQAFTDKLVEQAATLGLTKEALLQYDIANQGLNQTQLAAAQNAAASIAAFERVQKTIKDAADDQKIFDTGDNNQLEALENESRLEQEILAARNADYQSFYDNLVRQSEDLSIDLIGNDKKRAQAQLDIENERAIERIRLLQLEGEDIADLLEKQAEVYAKQVEKLSKSGTSDIDDLKRAVEGFGDKAGQAFEDFAFTGKASFGDLIDSVLKDLARLAIKRSVLDPLLEGFDASFSGFDFGSFFSGFGFAEGGRPPLNKVSMVGERGPELFMPDSAGTIIPNNALGGSNYNVVVNVDATGGKVQGDGDKAAELGRQIEGAVRSVLLKEKRPGGLIAA